MATHDGEVLSGQYNQFFLVSSSQGALTLSVTSTCLGSDANCEDLSGSTPALSLLAMRAEGEYSCPSTDTASNTGIRVASEKGLRLETTLCTSSSSVYHVAVRGADRYAEGMEGSSYLTRVKLPPS